MPLKDLSGKTVYDLEREDFEKLFCALCRQHQSCLRDDKTIHGCKAIIDSGIWDRFYRKK